ncbi:MAG: tyrosine-type recombinase/integrase [Gammaproteobacteria bacterium]|nr:tyrosine-type recombinase/integrase [Gammaproteobacteria bacterium]
MTRPLMKTLSNRMVDRLEVSKDTVFWDRDLTGFGVRVYPTGSKVYVAQARGPGGPRRVTVGRHGVIGADEARKRAALLIARVKAGGEAAPEPLKPAGSTVADLAERYLTEYAGVRCRPATTKLLRSVVRRHIAPALGKLPLAQVGRAHVAGLHRRLRATPASANSVVRVLSSMFEMAGDWGLVPGGVNPCRAIVKYPAKRRERFLTEAEFERLGRSLDDMETRGGASASAAAAVRLLMLTGCRKSEILNLRWEDVALDEAELRLADAKTGPRAVALAPAAVALLAGLPRLPGNPWVIPGAKPGARLSGLDHVWRSVREEAGLTGVRLHDLRHSFASRALALGEGLPVIAKLLGHARIETTARYAHLSRDSVRAAAERVADSIAGDLLEGSGAPCPRAPGTV